MTDRDLLEKKLARIVTCVDDLRRLARPEEIRRDVREERFVAHTLQMAAQAALDAASHIVSDQVMGEPQSNRELFDILARNGWIGDELASKLSQMAGFRNLLVHGYEEVNLAIVEEVVRHRLGDLLDFVAAVERRLTGPS